MQLPKGLLPPGPLPPPVCTPKLLKAALGKHNKATACDVKIGCHTMQCFDVAPLSDGQVCSICTFDCLLLEQRIILDLQRG